ncbi:hypothetical protein J2S43_000504 [Catenuloplanes nepalensis]|uniref:Uncharacterized protein n=1 Tax=Catenuloplanes nepalensis TaxID=587533 RepID=A0ABT9MKP4_9ACTN|nr:hypothetical protein [Catenuloplanes nepalensis]MDP9791992.1 hypothetical protein [Catenuloplanes nepalensis]
MIPLLLLAFAGILAGGAFSLHRQEASTFSIVITGLLAALAAAGGILWLIPE